MSTRGAAGGSGPAAKGAKPGAPASSPSIHAGGRKPQRKERIVVQDDGEGNWLMSYGDMMTLLFAFFVILSAFSTPDAAKMEKLKEETAKSMGVKYQKPFEELKSALVQIMKDSKLDNEMTLQETGDGVAIIANGTLFFDSGSAMMKPAAAQLIERLANILTVEAKGFRIAVEGHTDDVPMKSPSFPSNWELSSARAGTVVRLLESKGFKRKDLRPLGLADTEPLMPNVDANGAGIAANRAQNRRIVIRIQKQLPKRMETAPSQATGQPAAPAGNA